MNVSVTKLNLPYCLQIYLFFVFVPSLKMSGHEHFQKPHLNCFFLKSSSLWKCWLGVLFLFPEVALSSCCTRSSVNRWYFNHWLLSGWRSWNIGCILWSQQTPGDLACSLKPRRRSVPTDPLGDEQMGFWTRLWLRCQVNFLRVRLKAETTTIHPARSEHWLVGAARACLSAGSERVPRAAEDPESNRSAVLTALGWWWWWGWWSSQQGPYRKTWNEF